ncbi:MAG: DUF2177 family protein [Alphaproteobacteria bacterium]|nr:DUF2177 family protein [Alphaproteobacteria bacterium]
MPTVLASAGIAGVLFVLLDLAWFAVSRERLYNPELGPLLRAKVDFAAAAGFYVLYAFGMAVLVIAPSIGAGDAQRALFYGAALGLTAYATYNLTNLATLRGWSALVTFGDLAWGTFATAVACWATTMAMIRFSPAS